VPWQVSDEEVYTYVEIVIFVDKISPISTASWFEKFWSGQTFDLSNLDTSNVTDMSDMFNDSYAREFIGLDTLDVSNVTNMEEMFSGFNLGSDEHVLGLNISEWDTSNVTNMTYMFYNASTGYAAENPLDLSGWDVSKVTSYNDFILDITPEGSIIPPNFGATS